MAEQSGIEWTEATWNPTTGCDKTSPGCDNCYALTLANRLKAMGVRKYQRDGSHATSGPGFGLTMHEDVLTLPLKWTKPRTVFVNSMSDLFHPAVSDDFIQQTFEIIDSTPHHTYQVLTKRSKRMAALSARLPWPKNLWMGVSVETDRYLFRVNDLNRCGAAIRFLSLEPLLGPLPSLNLSGIDWVITGGESGPRARPAHTDWIRGIRDRCIAEDVRFFFKQWGGRTPKAGGRLLDGRTWNQMPTAGFRQLDREVLRTGRTIDLAQRAAQHASDPVLGDLEFQIEYRTDVYAEQRGLEQMLYDQYPGAQAANGGYNLIRGISPSNPNLDLYVRAAEQYLAQGGG